MWPNDGNPEPVVIVVATKKNVKFAIILIENFVISPKRLVPSGDETDDTWGKISCWIESVATVGSETDTDAQNDESDVHWHQSGRYLRIFLVSNSADAQKEQHRSQDLHILTNIHWNLIRLIFK